MARRRRRGVNPDDLTTATAEAEEKYGPEISTVRGLIDEARAQYEGDVTAAKSNARAVRSYARAAKPEVKKIYTGATSAADAAADDVSRAFGGLGSAADIFRAATAREEGGQRSRIAEAQANAKQSLVDRGVEAQAGQAFAVNNARSGYNKNIGTLGQKLADIGVQQGASIAARLGDLRSERAKRATDKQIARENAASRASEGAANRTSRESIAAANRAAADKRAGAKAGKDNRASAPRLEALSSEFAKAKRIAAGLSKSDSRSTAAEKLVQGTVIAKGDTSGTRPIPAFRELVASIALDMAYDGHVSRANAQKLHKLGYKVSDLPGAIDYTAYTKHVKDNTLDRPTAGGR